MSTPKQRRRGPSKGFTLNEHDLMAPTPWKRVMCLPGYVLSADGRLAREIKVRTNKNGTRWARVSIKGKQYVVSI